MTRIHSIKSTKLYLPPVTPSPMSISGEPVTLEVLIMAQKIASDRGQVFDIEAFMPSYLKEEWEASKRGVEWPRKEKEEEKVSSDGEGCGQVEADAEAEAKVKLEHEVVEVVGAGDTGADGILQEPIQTESAGPQALDPNTDLSSSAVITEIPTIPPTTEQAPAAPAVKQPFKLHPNHPALLNLHWKQRQKRLAQLAAREAAIARGQVPEYFPELEAMIRLEEEKEKERERDEEIGQKRKRGMTAADVENIRASASHWNHLLVEARRSRGPQWDYNTQQFQVDRSTEEYYTHMKPPRSNIKEDPQQLMNGHSHGQTHATPSSSQSTNRPLPQSRHSQSSSPVKPPSGLSQMPPPIQSDQNYNQSQLQRRMSGASGSAITPSQSGQMPLPPNSNYNPSPQQQHQQMYNPPPPNQYQPQQQQQFNPAQFLAMQQQHQQQQAQGHKPNQNQNQNPGMMNPALLMQAQQRLQQQARAGQGQVQGQGVNMASLMAGHGPGQGQGQGSAQGWNPNMGMSPAMMQSMGVGMGGGGSVGGAGPGGGWNVGQ